MSEFDWGKISNIQPSVWQENNRRWAAPQHYTCSYMAMFPPALPHYFIRRFTEPGDIILDPFSGRGTTALEAIAQDRIGIGNDLNDLAYVLTKGKLANPSLEDLLFRLDELESGYERKDWLSFKGMPHKIRMIYHPETQKHLMYLKQELDWRNNDVDAFLAMVLMGAMHGQSPGFLSLSMPNTFSMGWNYVKKYIKNKKLKRPNRDAFDIIRDRCNRFLRDGQLPRKGIAIHGDVRKIGETKQICEGSVKMIFSSPPYLKVIKYGLYNWIRLWWLIGEHKSIDEKLDDAHSINPYLNFMKEVLETTLPLLNPDTGLACWVIGDVKGRNLALEVWENVAQHIISIDKDGNEIRYKLLEIVEDKIPDSEKVTKIWKTRTHLVQEIQRDKVVRSIGEFSDFKEANDSAHSYRSAKVYMRIEHEEKEIQIIESTTNDKSGKATPTDRILIIAPETSRPKSVISNSEMDWTPIQ